MNLDTRLIGRLHAARRVVVVTGAGMSAESGIPTFRAAGGLWRHYRPEDLATPAAFARDPALVWAWYRGRQHTVAAAEPNAGHRALARLEKRLADWHLVTQNVDGLHQRAGSRALTELHGSLWRLTCSAGCPRVEGTSGRPVPPGDAPLPRCACGAWQRPGVVWFGERLDEAALSRAWAAASACDLLIAVGTSGVVYPAAALPELAKAGGATIVEVNVEETPLTPVADFVLRAPAATALPALEAAW